jgi:uncharacterized protein YkwD
LLAFALALAAGLVAGCGGASASGGALAADDAPVASGSPADRPKGPLSRADAERYVLSLINRDRVAQGLSKVGWDDTAAKAGTAHAEDMAAHGFTAHQGTDGSVPELRYTAAGGAAMAMENAGCLADGEKRELDPDPKFLPEELERIERAFMDEVPPHDGHRRNILTAWHTAVGVGLAQTKGLTIPCMAQEFVDDYGRYEALPSKAKPGDKVRVAGKLSAPAKIAGVGVARVDLPKPMQAKALNRTHSYAIPKPYATYFPRGFKTPIPVDVSPDGFHIEVPLSDKGKPGLYEVSVWAELPQTKDLVMVSLRTIEVR